ncbi:DUF177 domain-containing protein [Spiroplasma taiwanense]|uniref:Uncharacterized protein n=1 Tax=Spiroplasma taiwanense CT-1 TaxID=1276220 RepID=S5MCN3_9MOLU|nr:hypothetical protein [Spiroplasma taiwanense]AGR41478.1 hypothetical protein STAIW_v1c08920 [Spiroplasma taiwanense CT-1]
MLKKEIIFKKHIKFDKKIEVPLNYNYNHDLIKKISNLKVRGTFDYRDSIKSLIVKAKIQTDIEAIDARDGNLINLINQEFEWVDEYYFENINNDQSNVVFGEKFNILDYTMEQIVLNIPMNLTINYGKISFVGKDYILMSEEEYQQEQMNQINQRWEKLKDFKFKE